MKGFILPKLQDTKKYQRDLAEELEKIKGDAELLPNMFRAEAVFRNQCKEQKDEAIAERDKAMQQYNVLIKERDDLRSELDRKYRLSL